ncbi:Mobile element protein [Candidatus Enterovibrio altilux]|uniref:Mobile element protein n=1 Tax=Candidatus Enterovibrio altilux TaxID=1927128 RepID=A0A291B7I8_9GAMM|nr:Mobile element protein [Candidatus Enterovibrio luxaltus]
MNQKKLLEGTLNLREHNSQISEIYVIIKASNKLTGLRIPKIKAIV